MMSDQFIPAEISRQTRVLERELCNLIEKSKLSSVQLQIERVHGDVAQLTVAFVGNYNAGKSTILSALTGNADIPIDTDVCTDEVTGYRWHDLLLLDTPGVRAGFPDHDAQTEKAILDSDLIVFVITGELFSDVSAQYFQQLVFQRGKADQTLLVVNKMTLDSGTPEIKRPDIDAVCRPKRGEDFGMTFIDAKCYLDSLATKNTQDCEELRALSGFDSFVERLNEFALTRCDLGRLTSPIQRIRQVSEQAEALASVTSNEEAAAIEFVGRMVSCLAQSRRRLREKLQEPVVDVANQILDAGNDLADETAKGATQEQLGAKEAEVAENAEKACETLRDVANRIIEDEMEMLRQELKSIVESKLGQRVLDVLNLEGLTQVPDKPESVILGINGQIEAGRDSAIDRIRQAYRGAEGAQRVGDVLANLAKGPRFSGGGGLLKASEVAGGKAHKIVYEALKFFGKDFKPWEAVKIARILGNVGRVLNAAGAVLVVILEIAEEVKLREQEQKLLEHRNSIRTNYQEAARTVEREFWRQFEKFAAVQYGSQIVAFESFRDQIIQTQSDRRSEAAFFAKISEQATKLLSQLNSMPSAN